MLRDAALTVVWASGLASLYNRLAGRRRMVLSYHNVLPANRLTSEAVFRVDMSTDVFERQIAYLARRWTVQPAQAVKDPAAEGVFLTFDDGMASAATTIAPILERYGLTGVFAVCPGLVDGQIPHVWRDHVYLLARGAVGGSLRLPMDDYAQPVAVNAAAVDVICADVRRYVIENRVADVYGLIREIDDRNDVPPERSPELAERFGPMTWDQVQMLRAAGHVIASHTMTHRILSLLPTDEKRRELVESKAAIERRLSEPVEILVYPYGGAGEVDAETIQLAGEAGYQAAFANVPQPLDGPVGMAQARFVMPRTAFRPHMHATLSGLKHALRGRG